VRRLGFVRWKRLHRLVYAAAALGVVHFVWRVKADLRVPLIFAGAIAALLAIRIAAALRAQLRARAATEAPRLPHAD
jgi:sulfoxide reductase heme-binding subunit YedZ